MTNKNLFKIVWISKMINGTVTNPTMVKANSIANACKSVEKREGCIIVLSAKMVTGPFMTDKNVENYNDYKKL